MSLYQPLPAGEGIPVSLNLRQKRVINHDYAGNCKSANSSGVTDALKTAAKIADVALDFGLLKKKLKNAVEDAILDTKRMGEARQTCDGRPNGRHDLLDKEEPWQSVGYAAGAGWASVCL